MRATKDDIAKGLVRYQRQGGRVRRQLNDPEHQEAVSFWEEIQLRGQTDPELLTLYHVPNGGIRQRGMAGYMKAEGVRRGVPDYCLPLPTARHGALYIELKAPGGRPTEHQRWWIDALEAVGNRAVVCVGAQAAVDECLRQLEAHRRFMRGRG